MNRSLTRRRATSAPRLVAACVVVLAGLATLMGCTPAEETTLAAPPDVPAKPVRPVQLPTATLPDGFEVTLELATTAEEISQGLMYRPSLPESRGMLFLFGEERLPSFWMKDTLVSLDIVFLDERGVVVDVAAGARPCPAEPCPQFLPSEPCVAVLELLAGTAARHGVEIGARLEIEGVEGFPAPEDGNPPRADG